jgi:hypothetical protein
MIQTHQVGIYLIMIGIATVLMVVTAPTLENHQAIAVIQPIVKKVSVKDPPSKVKKDPPRKVRKVLRCGWFRGKHVCRWVPVGPRGPMPIRPLPAPAY